MREIPTKYNPKETEEKWYKFWEERGYFFADNRSEAEPYSIVIPPPNVTGTLHMGHALNNTLQDILIRWRRMQGHNTLWLPGTDHAGLYTQLVVERELEKEGINKGQLGREKFIERVWEWKNRHGDEIIRQLKKLGCSCDWTRTRFTLDEGLSRAVRKAFVTMYKEGLIYRGDYIVNWCPKCLTAISDLEVEYIEKEDFLYYIRYPGEDGGEGIVIATARPETILADVAVAVNPKDKRYRDLVGKYVILPIANRKLKVIQDDYINIDFGTGALKVTPAHDPADFEIGQRHNLPTINSINPDGTMNENALKYVGMDRFECKEAIIEDLKREGYLLKAERYVHTVGHHDRCGTVIEPYLSRQWYAKMKPLAEPAIRAVEEGRVRFVPESWTKTYNNWMYNIKDWCLSRQVWWGHRIPVWYCGCGETIASEEDPTECPKCGGRDLKQDEDVLDTWFSSWLWPISTMGWPERTRDLEVYYPTSVLITGFDIIFFWVARMIMSGLKFQGDVPFRTVYITPLVRDAEGKKMSKSKGNVIDPIDMIERYGTDAVRFTLAIMTIQGRDIPLSTERMEGYRNFMNKIWNASRLVQMNLDGDSPPERPRKISELADRWILSRLNSTAKTVNESLEDFRFNDAAQALYDFFWRDYCDWYLEIAKLRLYQKEDPEARGTAQYVMHHTLEAVLRLMHPFIPFITEEIWQSIPHEGESIMTAPWVEADPSLIDEGAESRMSTIVEVVRAIRNVRAEMGVEPGRKIDAILRSKTPEVLEESKDYIISLARLRSLSLGRDVAKPEAGATAVVPGTEIYLPLAGMIDAEKERERLNREIAKTMANLEVVRRKLGDRDFTERAPKSVVEKERERERELSDALRKLEDSLRKIASLEE
ncbi:MAG: valine--tRNA ligase [bacterium]